MIYLDEKIYGDDLIYNLIFNTPITYTLAIRVIERDLTFHAACVQLLNHVKSTLNLIRLKTVQFYFEWFVTTTRDMIAEGSYIFE